jgi:YggT family protein
MSAFLTEAGIFLVQVLFGIYILAVLLRFLLQSVRADFYNPVSQFVVTLTNPLLRPLRRVIPGLLGVDLASVVLLVALQCLELYLILLIGTAGSDVPRSFSFPGLLLAAVIELVRLTIYVFLFAILIRAVLSWVSPSPYAGRGNPATALLVSLTEPLLRPARRLLPPMQGLDLSPLLVMAALSLLLLALKHLIR